MHVQEVPRSALAPRLRSKRCLKTRTRSRSSDQYPPPPSVLASELAQPCLAPKPRRPYQRRPSLPLASRPLLLLRLRQSCHRLRAGPPLSSSRPQWRQPHHHSTLSPGGSLLPRLALCALLSACTQPTATPCRLTLDCRPGHRAARASQRLSHPCLSNRPSRHHSSQHPLTQSHAHSSRARPRRQTR